MNHSSPYVGKTAYHGEVAANYERDRVNEPVWMKEQTWMEAWAKGIPAGARVLDVPTGTGRFVEIFLARRAKVHAVDVSVDMLAELRRRYPPDGDRLVVERGDAEALSYPDGMFDFVVCWRLFHLLPAPIAERVLREMARVCRGQIVVEVFGVETGGVRAALRRQWRRLVRKAGWSEAGSVAAPWAHITNYVQREKELLRLFSDCGLRVAGAETLAHYRGAPARVYFLDKCGEKT